MIEIVPAIIPETKTQLEEEIKKISKFARLVQIDVSDGIFTSIKTWPYITGEKISWPENINIEVHLMVDRPEEKVSDWIDSGVKSIVAHIEATNNFQKVIDICRRHSVSVGVAIKPSTDISKLEPFVFKVDFIQIMGNDELGKHGVELDPRAVERIKMLRAMYSESIIAVDIGVSEDTAQVLVSAGANKLISGSAILDADNPEKVFRYFESLSDIR
ncbi:MAG: hypothetical protein HY507_01360 [Candidatus Zambryskibacteria bacterium]|nr:hypothetical protein [Candidatus Zambryskibacteria bacterium]